MANHDIISNKIDTQGYNIQSEDEIVHPKTSSKPVITSQEPEFMDDINPTDPEVHHDPLKLVQDTVGFYQDNKSRPEELGPIDTERRGTNQRVERTVGKHEPIVKIYDRDVSWASIVSMRVDFGSIPKTEGSSQIRSNGRFSNDSNIEKSNSEFLPTIELEIDEKTGNDIMRLPALSDKITVVLVPTIEKTYRNISLTFWLISQTLAPSSQTSGTNTWHIYGKYYGKELYETHSCSVIAHKCSDCKLEEDKMPTIWERCHEISKTLGLGFSSTRKTRECADNYPTRCTGESYVEYLENAIKQAGTGPDTIFDGWIDFNRYLTLVNLPYVFNAKVNYKNYDMQVAVGYDFTDEHLPHQKAKRVHRMISNFNSSNTVSNLDIVSVKWIVNREGQINQGIRSTISTLTPNGFGGNDSMNSVDIMVTEKNSDAIYANEYAFGSAPVVCYNTIATCNPALQEELRRKYLESKRSVILRVEMRQINFALQRGTLVQVALWESDPVKKQIIISNLKNGLKQYEKYNLVQGTYGKEKYLPNIYFTDDAEKTANENFQRLFNYDMSDYDDLKPSELGTQDMDFGGPVSEKDLVSSHAQIPDYYKSGLYYIDGIRLTFNNDSQEIKQYLYLINKDFLMRPNDIHMPLRFDEDKY